MKIFFSPWLRNHHHHRRRHCSTICRNSFAQKLMSTNFLLFSAFIFPFTQVANMMELSHVSTSPTQIVFISIISVQQRKICFLRCPFFLFAFCIHNSFHLALLFPPEKSIWSNCSFIFLHRHSAYVKILFPFLMSTSFPQGPTVVYCSTATCAISLYCVYFVYGGVKKFSQRFPHLINNSELCTPSSGGNFHEN